MATGTTKVLVTGMSGAGKSTLLAGLARRGHRVLDTDDDGWTLPDGRWDERRVTDLLARAGELVMSGTVENQGLFYDRFDHVVLLSAPLATLLERVRTRSTNPYGRHPDERAEIARHLATVEPQLRRRADLELDGRTAPESLVDAVESLLWTGSSTHRIVLDRDRVTKTYQDWGRGEHRREAAALVHLDRHAPGLAPVLLGADLEAVPPCLLMTRVAGATIDARPWSSAEIDRLRASLDRLWSVPPDALPALPGHPAHRIGFWRDRVRAGPWPALGPALGPTERRLYDRVVRWLGSADAGRLDTLDSDPVLGHGDPRVANLLVTDTAVRFVDFEDAGLSHRAYELANTVEHLGNRGLGFEALLDQDLGADPDHVLLCRRLVALFWFLLLAPGGAAAGRNPPGTFERQAHRLARLLD